MLLAILISRTRLLFSSPAVQQDQNRHDDQMGPPAFLSSMFGKQQLLFYTFSSLCLLSSCCFFAKSPLSSPLLCFADDEIVQIHKLYGIWADNQELMRNLASLAAAPTLSSPLFSVMMPWCSKFKIRWWLTCFWGLYYCYYSFFWYIVVL